MKKFFLLFLPIFLFGCQEPKPNNFAPPAIPSVTNPIQTVDKTASQIDKIIDKNTEIRGQINQSKNTIEKQKQELTAAISEASFLREKLSKECNTRDINISKLESAILAAQKLNTELEKENENLKTSAQLNGELLEQSRTTVRLLTQEIQALRSAEQALRAQVKGVSTQLEKQSDYIDSLEKDKDKLISKAASATVYKNWVIGIFVSIVIIVLISFGLKRYGLL